MALAFDDSTDLGLVVGETSLTASHTTSGLDRILFVGLFGAEGVDRITDVTYNAVALTRLGEILVKGHHPSPRLSGNP